MLQELQSFYSILRVKLRENIQKQSCKSKIFSYCRYRNLMSRVWCSDPIFTVRRQLIKFTQIRRLTFDLLQSILCIKIWLIFMKILSPCAQINYPYKYCLCLERELDEFMFYWLNNSHLRHCSNKIIIICYVNLRFSMY